jgi:hypothetical protein
MRHLDAMTLQRYADGELGARRSRVVSAHVESCAECAAAVERVRSVGDALRLAFDEQLAGGVLDGFADRVMATVAADPRPLPWRERAVAWLGEFTRYRKRIWAPSLALSGAAAVALLLVVAVGADVPARSAPAGSSVLSVSFGSTVDGAVFELEDKDGTTTAVIWLDESKTAPGDTEARRGALNGLQSHAAKSKNKTSSALAGAFEGIAWEIPGAKWS